MNTEPFRPRHAVVGSPVRYYYLGQGLVTGEVSKVSRSGETVWVYHSAGHDLQYSRRQDGEYRRKGHGLESPTLEHVVPTGKVENSPSWTPAMDYTTSSRELDRLSGELRRAVPNMMPDDYTQLLGVLKGLTPRKEGQQEGRACLYSLVYGHPQRGTVTRSSKKNIWVTFEDGLVRRFSKRQDNKYRLSNTSDREKALIFYDEELEDLI